MASEVPPPPDVTDIVMTITYNPATSALQVSGPIENRILAYGMLESAREAIIKRSLGAKTEGGRVILPHLFGRRS